MSYYNEGPLLRECLESLLAQPERPDEILVYDAGIHEPASSYIPYGAPVRLIVGGANRGPSFARNILWQECRAEYVHFQDADDLFGPGFCRVLRQAIEREAVDFFVNQVLSFRDDGVRCEEGPRFDFSSLRQHRKLARFCFAEGANTACGTVRRSRLERIGGWDEDLWHKEDVDVWLRLALAGATWAIVEEPIIQTRLRSGSHSGNGLQAAEHSFRFLMKVREYAPAEYSDLVREYSALSARWCFLAGRLDEAQQAAAWAHEGGRPQFLYSSRMQRVMYRLFGIVQSERLFSGYRSVKRVLR